MSWADDEGFDYVSGPEDVELIERFKEESKQDFINQMTRKNQERKMQLLKKEVEPANSFFYRLEYQENHYYLWLTADKEVVDVRTIGKKYAYNLHHYLKRKRLHQGTKFAEMVESRFK